MANNQEVDALNFEDDDLMDEDGGVDVEPSSSPRAPQPKLKSAITSAAPKKTKGRGFREEADAERHSRLADRNFESLGSDGGPGPQRSIEGWIILATGVHEEAQEDDLQNAFGEFGEIRNLHLNLDRRTGFVKGYALIEYENYEEAQNAITAMNGTELLTHTINVDWAFSNGPSTGPFKRKNMRKSPMKRQVPGEGTYGVVYKAIDDTKEDMKTTAFWDWFLIVIGSVFFLGFLFTAVISKLLPVSDNLILSAIQNDRYYCFLVPLTLPIAVVSVYFHWLSMKLFKHA